MKAEAGKTYAIIANNQIAEIFTIEKYPEWDESSLQVIELSKADLVHAGIGSRVDSEGKLLPYDIQKHKQVLLNIINSAFEAECEQVKGLNIPSDEQYTWEQQKQEAAKYLQTGKEADAPLLATLAKQRGIKLKDLATKADAKAKAFTHAIALLVGNRQKLEDKILASKTAAELEKISYSSPLLELAKKA